MSCKCKEYSYDYAYCGFLVYYCHWENIIRSVSGYLFNCNGILFWNSAREKKLTEIAATSNTVAAFYIYNRYARYALSGSTDVFSRLK